MKKTTQPKPATTPPAATPVGFVPCKRCEKGFLPDGGFCSCSQGNVRKRFAEMKATAQPAAAAEAAAQPPAPEVEPVEVPNWVNETPYQTYELETFQAGDAVQSIEMTRDEYIALKQHLARMRGYEVGEHTDVVV